MRTMNAIGTILVLLAMTALAPGCRKKATETTLSCEKQYERNARCADELVEALVAESDLTPSQQTELRENTRKSFTTESFLSMCQQDERSAHKRSAKLKAEVKRLEAGLRRCHAKPDCRAFAACYAAALKTH